MLPPGKLPIGLLDKMLKKYTWAGNGHRNSRVIIGPQVGQDTAVVDIGDRYLVSKIDPVTFATDEIGYYVVNINANDISTAGAKPAWFQATLLLPEKNTDESLVESIFQDISSSCKTLDVAWIGGHTEITFGLDRPIVIGSMYGEVAKDRLVTSMGGKPGDALILTKGIVIEGAAIIAKEKELQLLKRGVSPQLISRGKALLHNPGLSIVKEAQLLHQNFHIHAMHDPTEGGLAMGLVELAENSHCGLLINYPAIPIIEDSIALCRLFNLDPMGTITSGTLLAALPVDEVESALKLLHDNKINAACIGELTNKVGQYSLQKSSKEKIPLQYSQKDEITKIFR